MMVWQRAFRFTFRLWYGESTSKPFNFAIPFNYSKIHTPQGLHPTMPPDIGPAEIHNWTNRKRASEVVNWPRKPLFYAFLGGLSPGEGFFYCIKISRNIEASCWTLKVRPKDKYRIGRNHVGAIFRFGSIWIKCHRHNYIHN